MFRLGKIKKIFIPVLLTSLFYGCGGGGSGVDVSEETQTAEGVIFTTTGISGTILFSSEDGNTKTYEITNIVPDQCSIADFTPVRFTLSKDAPTFTYTFSIPFTNPCMTDSFTLYYDLVTTYTAVDGSTYEDRESFTQKFNNSVYDQSKVTVIPGSDPLYKYQWHLENTGQSEGVLNPATPGEDINVTAAWAEGITGKGIVVAVIDEGVDIFHPDLKDNILISLSYNYHYGTNNTTPVIDSFAHGTAVAGLIAAKAKNGIGTVGVSPDAKLASLNALEVFENEISSQGYTGAELQLVRLFDALTRNLDSIDIYNNSWGRYSIELDSTDSLGFDTQLATGVKDGRNGKGAVYVKSSGNGRNSCGIDGVICDNANFEQKQTSQYFIVVSAVNAQGTVSSYSTPGSNVLVAAPGGEVAASYLNLEDQLIVTTDLPGDTRGYDINDPLATSVSHFNVLGNENYDYTQRMNGTSSAAPIVSGVVALMLEANPDLTYRDVRMILAQTARQNDQNNTGWKTNGAGFHYHNDYGFGVVNASKAVNLAKNWTSVGGYNDIVTISDSNTSTTINIDQNITIEHVYITFDIDTANLSSPANLEIRLSHTDSNGAYTTESVLVHAPNGLPDTTNYADTNLKFASVQFMGESSAGSWDLNLTDKGGGSVTLNSWNIFIEGH